MGQMIDQAYLERRLALCREFEAVSTHPDVRQAYAGEAAHCEMLLAALQAGRQHARSTAGHWRDGERAI